MIQYSNIPKELQVLPNWVCFRFMDRDGKRTKVPFNPLTNARAKANDPETWCDYATCGIAADTETYDGIGFQFSNSPFVGVDIDHCVDPVTGEMTAEAADIIQTLDSYTEYTPSGTGVHIICRGDMPKGGNRRGAVEMYAEGRYFTMTGNVVGEPKPVRAAQKELLQVHDKYIKKPEKARQTENRLPQARAFDVGLTDDGTLIGKAKRAKNGTQFEALFNGDASAYGEDHSAADQAFCNMLAYWTKKDAEQMDRIFRQSGLMREKWDTKHSGSGSTYGEMTIEKAISDCETVYDPQGNARKKSEKFTTVVQGESRTLADLQPDKNDRYKNGDIGNGCLFADWYKDKARFVTQRRKWFVFDGRQWKEDPNGSAVMRLCKTLAKQLVIYAGSINDDTERDSFTSKARKWNSRHYRETILKDAKDEYPINIDRLDSDPFLLNCLNGTLNLNTGKLHPHRSDEFHSKMANVKFCEDADTSRWDKFMNEVMEGDEEKTRYLQKSFGYGLTGSTAYECFFMLHGATTRNGKGTTMETYMYMVGEYGKTASPDTITQKNKANGGGPSEDIARLAGARVVNISEPDERMTLNTALVKTMTGSDTITARFLNENSFEYKPQFKLFSNTNHLPRVTDMSIFQSGRVKVVPFERHFSEEEQNKKLKAELRRPENLSGLLNWCLQGWWLLEKEGFKEPESVRKAIEEYWGKSDKIGQFMADELEMNFMEEVTTTAVYERYQEWCVRNGVRPEGSNNFIGKLKSVAEIKRKRPNGSHSGKNPATFLINYKLKPKWF